MEKLEQYFKNRRPVTIVDDEDEDDSNGSIDDAMHEDRTRTLASLMKKARKKGLVIDTSASVIVGKV